MAMLKAVYVDDEGDEWEVRVPDENIDYNTVNMDEEFSLLGRDLACGLIANGIKDENIIEGEHTNIT